MHGIEQVYTTVRTLKDDLRNYKSNYMISVPLVYETFYSGIQKQISSSPNAIKLIVFSFIRISLAYTELKIIYENCMYLEDSGGPYLDAHVRACVGDEFRYSSTDTVVI